ncbi:MAG: DUF1800 domain-containing protein [Planctomycetes bacterium]|nr:DUF1800 domain-containing protein [Planctomycetota bacterium]
MTTRGVRGGMRSCRYCLWAVAVLLAAGTAVMGGGRIARADEPPKVDPELDAARKHEATTRGEESSREMARSATREIARSERRRSEESLARWREVHAALQAAIAASRPEAELAELRASLEERTTTLRTDLDRLISDTIAGNKASNELFPSEMALRDAMSAVRDVEIKPLEAASNALADETARLLTQAGKEADAKAKAVEAVAARRALLETKAVRVMEIQQWAAIRKDTADELIEQSGEAAQIARDSAAIETDVPFKQRLEQFVQQQEQEKAAAAAIRAEALQAIDNADIEIHTLRSAAIGGLKPLAPDQWDYAKARHLLVRAGFGGTPKEVEKLHAMGLHNAVDFLVEFYRQPVDLPALELTPPLVSDPLRGKMRHSGVGNRAVRLDPQSVEANQLIQVRRWWLRRLVESPRPLQEKLTLFWHGHFASQNSVVNNSYTMLRQNEFFRQHAAGNFGAMLYGIVHDPAMIRYLDNNKNIKGNPNENLAREIMELFSMGVDQGYTEHDIVEAARALTGYTFDHATGTYRFVYEHHDTTEKTIFGKKGTWTGDDLVRLILERPETSRFVAKKLFEYFAYQDPDAATIDGLAIVLSDRQYALEPMLKSLFLSEEFYSARSMGTQVKSPVELMVGLLRDLGVKPQVVWQPIERPLPKSDGTSLVIDVSVSSYETLDKVLGDMGMLLLEPPDVKGWRYGRPWIDSQRLFVRYNAVASLIEKIGSQGVDVVTLIREGGCKTSEEAVDYLAKACLAQPLSKEKRDALVQHLGALPPEGEWAGQQGALNERLRSLLMLMLCVPEHQLS